MKKIYNLPGLVKRCFLLTLIASVMTISYGQTVNQKSYDETQGSSVATPSLTENMSLKHGFKLIFDVGYQYQLESFFADVNRIKFNVVGNYQFNPYVSAGVGLGTRYYYDVDLLVFPFFYDMRVRLLDKALSPYFSIGAGYTFLSDKGFVQMGLYFNPEMGISYRIKENVNIHFTLGYETQNAVLKRYEGTHFTTYNLGAFSTTFGITF